MATKYPVIAGGAWQTDATWTLNSDGTSNATTAPTASDAVIMNTTSGPVTIGAAAACLSYDATTYDDTLTHNAFVWTISGSATFGSSMTYTPLATATITFAANGTLTTAGKLLPLVICNTGITVTLGDNTTTMASKVITWTLNGNSLDLNGKTLSGNSDTNRLLIRSNTLGTARTITNTTGTFANADFRDITLSSAADLSAITGLSGDCGGNTNITFTTAATQTYTGGTGSWSDSGNWTSRVPLPQDDVSMSGVTGGTITADMPRLGKSIDWTGASGTPAWAYGTNSWTSYGSLTLISAMSITNTSGSITFEGRGAFTLTSAGQNITGAAGTNVTFSMFGGSMTLQDAMTAHTAASGGSFALTNGTFNSNNFNVTVGVMSATGSLTRSLLMGNSLWNIYRNATAATIWNMTTTTGLTFDAGTSTILFSNTGANAMTFAGGGLTYNDLKIAGGGAGAVIITGANTFNRIYTDGGGTKTITLPGSTTTTLISGQGLNNGSNIITFTASAGSATISKASGGSGDLDYKSVNLTNIIAAATGTTYYAGAAPPSVDGGGNTNWTFSDDPTPNAGRGLSDGNKNDNVNVYGV